MIEAHLCTKLIVQCTKSSDSVSKIDISNDLRLILNIIVVKSTCTLYTLNLNFSKIKTVKSKVI